MAYQPPMASAAHHLREKQIATLFSPPNLNARVVTPGTTFEVPCYVSGTTVFIRINLRPDFPQRPPEFVISSPAIRHPDVDERMNVMVDSLRSWNMHQSILRRVAQDVVDTLQRTPPILVGAVPPPFTAYNPMNAYQPQMAQPPIVMQPPPAMPFQPSQPVPPTMVATRAVSKADIPDVFKDMSIDQLRELMENDAQLLEIYQQLDVVKQIKAQEDACRIENETLARL